MIIFFDGVSDPGYIGLFNEKREFIQAKQFRIALSESTLTLPIITDFMEESSHSFSDVTQIVCVVGPGSFTGIRTISLVINTIAYVYPNIGLTAVSFFDLYDHYPVIKPSSKHDLFVKSEKGAIIEIQKNEEVLQNYSHISQVYGNIDERFPDDFQVTNFSTYEEFLVHLHFENLSKIAPLYIKKPNIS